MKILIFGAGGKSGPPLVRQALEAGHTTTVFIRRPHQAYPDDDTVKSFVGDALIPEDVSAAVPGHDAVIVLLGPAKGSPPDITERATRNIIQAMEASGVKRLIVASSVGIGTPAKAFKGRDRFFVNFFNLFYRKSVKDRTAQFNLTVSSSLDWTICRLPQLDDKLEPTGYREVPEPGVYQPGLNRKDSAAVFLSLLDDPGTIGRAPFYAGI